MRPKNSLFGYNMEILGDLAVPEIFPKPLFSGQLRKSYITTIFLGLAFSYEIY